MKVKKGFQLYTGMWLVATLFLLAFLWQNIGDARVINYSGIVRGATQKLIKQELNGNPDDDLIVRLDGIIYDLQTGKGEFGIRKNKNKEFQRRLSELNLVWEKIKTELGAVRAGNGSADSLYDLSEQHFDMADQLVYCEERNTAKRLTLCIGFYCVCLFLSIVFFSVLNRRNQKKIEVSLSIDSLTGLMSRGGFEEKAVNLLSRNHNCGYVIVEFDIDNFKGINKIYGYSQGDRLMQSVAQAILDWKGDSAVCARIDADNFVLLHEQSDSLISELTGLLKQAVKQQKVLESLGDVGFTLGAYQIENNRENIKTIMDKADTAHKTAKLIEHKAIIWYDEKLIEKIELENGYREQMQQGLLSEEFKLYLQPQVELSSMELIGAEALVRWDKPDQGLVFPDSFIPLFEKNGSIMDLDYYMLEKACAYLRAQLDRGAMAFTVSVNFSRVTLYHKQFYDTVLEITDRYQLPHSYIEVEVTESAFNEVTDTVLQTIQRLKDAGFYISMDDFGAGYSNLNMLSRLPIHIIKLDREFVLGLDQNKNVRGIIACVVDMAHAMGIKVICEGVEQEEHVHFLRKIGCDYAQGYYFSRPVSQNKFEQTYHSFKMQEFLPVQMSAPLTVSTASCSNGYEIYSTNEFVYEEILLKTYPGFLSLRDEKQRIIYLNDNFKDWIKRYTDVDPLGKTNIELSAIVPENVADTFMQCHDGSMELQKHMGNKAGLKKVIEFRGAPGADDFTQYFDVLKYWVIINEAPYIFTIAYDITKIYLENVRNFKSSMTDSLTGVHNRNYLQSEISLYLGHYAALFDLDNFKMVNDCEGHNAGDEILKGFVAFMEEHLTNLITMVRLGGDEFLAVFEKGDTEENIRRDLQRVRNLFENTYSMYSYLSFSMGIDQIGQEIDETLRCLDRRMYEDKKRKSDESPGENNK